MRKLIVVSALAAAALSGSAASAQLVEPGVARDIGRAVGEAAVAAERAAADAAVSARQAWRAARDGYARSGGRLADRDLVAGSEDAAVDACALAAEEQGYERGFRAVVRDIDGVQRTREGFNVDGVVEARRGWRDPRPETWGFRCAVRDGRVVNVDLGQEFARR
jgi:hypothetical protein